MGIGVVYENVLSVEATWRQLETADGATLSADVRALVEDCTHPEALKALADELGASWREAWGRQWGRDSARAGDATAGYDALNDAAFRALSRCTKPTLAMIHGFCLGGGLAVALCTDIRLADDNAEFAIPAAKLGLGYNARWVRPLLAAVPPAKAKEMLFTGRRFKVAEAQAMGLVNAVVPSSELEARTLALAGEIAANAPLTVRAAKRTIDELVRHPQTPDLAALDAAVAACFESEDYAEGRLAFKEKRKPRFQGR